MPSAIINGFRMYYEVTGSGVPLLFVHGGLGGGNGSARFRHYHMTELARYARVIAFDRRAAGQSETPAAAYTFMGFVADCFGLLDHLGHQRAVLMGHSAGGPQVLQATLTHPERVLGLILGSTATQTVRVPPELAPLITSLGTDGLTHLQALLSGPTATASPMENFAGVLHTYLAYHLHGDPLATRLHEITAPTLILHGTADEEVPFFEAERLLEGLPAATLMPFAEGGHGIMVTHADAYRQAMIPFLQSVAETRCVL